MKKHVFGAALFSFIVASFAIVYALFFARPEIPTIEPVRLSPPERRSYCYPKRSEFKAEVQSSNYFVADGKIVTKIRLSVKPGSELPSSVSAALNFSSSKNVGGMAFETIHQLNNPFPEGPVTYWTIETRVSKGQFDLTDENLYVNATVGRSNDGSRDNFRGEVTQAKSVLFVFGTEKQGPGKLRVEPLKSNPVIDNYDIPTETDSAKPSADKPRTAPSVTVSGDNN